MGRGCLFCRSNLSFDFTQDGEHRRTAGCDEIGTGRSLLHGARWSARWPTLRRGTPVGTVADPTRGTVVGTVADPTRGTVVGTVADPTQGHAGRRSRGHWRANGNLLEGIAGRSNNE